MSLFVIGLDYHTASIPIREQATVSNSNLAYTLKSIKRHVEGGIVIVSTCNRTEWIGQLQDAEVISQLFIEKLGVQDLSNITYLKRGNEAFYYLCELAIGLHSMVLGEPQIFGQIKFAVATAQQCNTLTSPLLAILNDIFYITKRVRSETDIGKHALSLGYATTQMAERIFGDLDGKDVLLLATGEINLLVAQHLLEHHCRHFYICNRTVANAEKFVATLAQRYPQIMAQHTLCDLHDIATVLSKVDIVSSCSASPEPLITHSQVMQALKPRKHRPIFMVDLAIPRDIEPRVAEIDDVFLYTIDDLQYVMDGNTALRQSAAVEATKLAHELCQSKINVQQQQSITDDLLAYRHTSNLIREQMLEQALHNLNGGMEAAEALELLSKQLTTRLTHNPSIAIKAMAALPEESQKPLLAIFKQPLRD